VGVWVDGWGREGVWFVGMTDGVGPAVHRFAYPPHTPTLPPHTHARTELNLALVALFMPSLPVVTFYSSHMFELSVGQVSGFVG